jgi:O-succinylhomoserine sulfhydrylase
MDGTIQRKKAAPDVKGWKPQTRAVRGGLRRSSFDETSEALFLTSGYAYNSAEEAEATFKGESTHFQYSRFGNPTVSMFQDRLAALEGAEACIATATGMSAVFYALLALLKAGDRIVAARQLFGSCHYIINDLLPKYGIKGEFVDGGDLTQWEKALSTPAQAVLFESPSNPMLDIVDVEAVCDLAHKAGAKVVLDNAFATPILQRPLEFGADVVVHSATKYIDGQGRALGGAILGSRDFIIGKLQPITRNTGPSISPFNAWVFVKGLETLGLRIDRHCANARKVADALAANPKIGRVLYPGRSDHPQHALAAKQMSDFGGVVTFDIKGGKPATFEALNRLQLVDISNNLGDAKSMVTHPATTTHMRIGAEERAKLGIGDGTVRISVGLEDVEDVIADLTRALG